MPTGIMEPKSSSLILVANQPTVCSKTHRLPQHPVLISNYYSGGPIVFAISVEVSPAILAPDFDCKPDVTKTVVWGMALAKTTVAGTYGSSLLMRNAPSPSRASLPCFQWARRQAGSAIWPWHSVRLVDEPRCRQALCIPVQGMGPRQQGNRHQIQRFWRFSINYPRPGASSCSTSRVQ